LRLGGGGLLDTAPAERGPLVVAGARWQGAKLVVRFDGVDDRTTAEGLRRTRLFVDAASRPALADPDDFYDTDLVGLAVVDPGGAALGTVTGVEHGAGGDRLVVTREGADHLVPFVAALVPEVDVAARRVVVDAPEGLWDL
jgi:16S rRNA processing protein RimM